MSRILARAALRCPKAAFLGCFVVWGWLRGVAENRPARRRRGDPVVGAATSTVRRRRTKWPLLSIVSATPPVYYVYKEGWLTRYRALAKWGLSGRDARVSRPHTGSPGAGQLCGPNFGPGLTVRQQRRSKALLHREGARRENVAGSAQTCPLLHFLLRATVVVNKFAPLNL